MEWTIIIVLLILAIICFFISLLLRDNSYDERDSEAEEALLEANREIYQLKKQIQDLEDQLHPRKPLSEEELYQTPSPKEPEGLEVGGYDDPYPTNYEADDAYPEVTYEDDDPHYDPYEGQADSEEGTYSGETQVFHKGDFVPDPDDYYYEPDDTYSNYEADDQSLAIKDHIISLYHQGEALGNIADELNVPVTTVQLVIDNYLEEQSMK